MTSALQTMKTLSLQLARLLMPVRQSTATAAGTITTLVDASRDESDDFWNGGTLWPLAVPLSGVCATVTDWVLSTHTFTFTAQPAAPGAVAYQVAPNTYPKDVLYQSIVQALNTLRWPQVDESQVTTANMEELTLPTGVYDVRQVYVATSASAPYNYALHYYWSERDGKIIFASGKGPAAAGNKIRLVYMGCVPGEYFLDTNSIEDNIPAPLLLATARVHALEWRQFETGADMTRDLQQAMALLELARGRYPVPVVSRTTKLGSY